MKAFIFLAVFSITFAEFTTGDEISTDYINFIKRVYTIIGIKENYDDLLRCINDNAETGWKKMNEAIQLYDLKTLEGASFVMIFLTFETITLTNNVLPCSKDPSSIMKIAQKILEIANNKTKFMEKVSKNLGRIGKEVGDYIKAWKAMNTIECGNIEGNLIKWFYL